MDYKTRVLIVDDEPQILRVMRASLSARGYDVATAPNGQGALAQIDLEMPDLIILDLMMPDLSGLEVCRLIRQSSCVPIIVLSAKGMESDKVSALNMGADDYVTKPFGMNELLARIRAVSRRIAAQTSETPVIAVGDLVIDASQWLVTVAGKEIKLTPKEFDILKHLVKNAGTVVRFNTLFELVWGANCGDQKNYLRVFINQLRRKIEPNPDQPQYILTEQRVGYKFCAQLN
jgi:two-component system KDP operon response regulator KdpE